MTVWILITGFLVAANCGLLGSYLVLRRNAMIGDAISHAVLPGIVLAFMATGDLGSPFLIVGAAFFGLLSTFLIETFQRNGRLQADAAIGLTFTWLFAIGVILVSLFTANTHIDTECVMHGEITLVAFDDWRWNGRSMGPVPVWQLGGLLLLNSFAIIIGYRSLFASSFDPDYARGRGLSAGLWHYVLMSLVSLTTVLSFESVGAILVIAFLIVPAATAYLLTERLRVMLLLAVLIGLLDVWLGIEVSKWLDSSVSGAITAVSGLVFGLVFVGTRIRLRMQRQESLQATV